MPGRRGALETPAAMRRTPPPLPRSPHLSPSRRAPGARAAATSAVALALTVSAAASAQPAPIGPPGPPAAPGTATAPAAQPPPSPASAPPAPAPAPEVARSAAGRPAGLAVGIGVGYVFPAALDTPSTTSARLRFASGLTLEPTIVLSTSSIDLVSGGTERQTQVTLGSVVRYPVRARDQVDLEIVASAFVSSRGLDREGDDDLRTVTTLDLGYGLALGYWLSPHWSLSVTATNPLVSVVRTRAETGPDTSEITYASSLGLVFDPRVSAMLHLYF